MKAEEFLKEKYKKGGCYPWSQFDYSEMVANMEEFAAEQLKNCNLQNVSNSALPPLSEFATKALDNIADACRYITSGNASHQSKSIEGSAKRNAEFIRKHYC
jgi:hypothetical protein